jgi:cytochrome P450/glycosyltransferase involved in cell wall biosynthesis
MAPPLFSIVIPTFNYGRFLGRAIDSVLAQSGDDYELVVVDDGSTDDTSAVVALYGSQVQCLRQDNRGVFLACKRGLDATSGRFLIYLDADDALTPDALRQLRRGIERRPDVGLIAGRHVTVTPAGRRYSAPLRFGASRRANFRSFLLGQQGICTGAAAIRRDAVELTRRYEGELRVGLETACVAHTLWFNDAVALDHVLLEVHEHPGRLRDNLAEIRLAGEALVDAVFHRDILPPEAGRYRKVFRARLLRDRARSYFKASLHPEAVQHFNEALQTDPGRTVLDVRNLRRYAISLARIRFTPKLSLEVERLPSREGGVAEVSGSELLWGHRRRLSASAHQFLRRCSEHGPVVKLDLARPTYLLSNPRDILHVFVDQPARYRRTGLQAAFRPLFGGGLFSRTGASHIVERRVIQPLLHRGRLEGFLPPLRQTLAEFLPSWRHGQIIEAGDTVRDVIVRAAGRMILGLERAADAAELFAAIHASHQRVVRNMQSSVALPQWLPTRRNRTLKSHIARLDAVIHRLTSDARAAGPRSDLLSQLVHLRGPAGARLSDRQIRDHALTMFLAAYDPPATALTWTLHLLARHPGVQQRVQQEIDASAPQPAGDRDTNASALGQRPFLTQVMLESLRLYPSTWLLTRRAAETDALPGGASIPRGADVFASPLLIHRDPQHYDEPNEFRPERFAAGTTDRRAAGTYFPFGLGPAACLGEYLAKLMIAATLDAILARFTLTSCESDSPQIFSTNLFTMQPDRPIRLKLADRVAANRLHAVAAA